MKYVDPVHLRQVLTQYYNEGELRTMCFDMGIDYESIGGRGKGEKVVELVAYAQRYGRLDQIAAYVRQTRDFIQLKTTDTLPELPKAIPGMIGSGATIYVEGDLVQGDKMSGDKVQGDQYNLGDISNVSGLAVGKGAKATGGNVNTGTMIGSVQGSGSVTAQNIAGGDININPNPQDKADFVKQLQELKALLEKAMADGEFASEDDGQDAVEDLDKAIREADKESPRANQLKNRLETVTNLIQTGTKAGAAILKATPIIAGLIKAASIIF